MNIAVLFLGMIAFMLVGVPLAFSILAISIVVLMVFTGIPLWQVAQRFFAGVDSFVLTAIPFFLLAGNIMNEGKITDKLLNLSDAVVGHIRGGLAHVNVLVSFLFGGVSGSAVADTSGIGAMLIPAMIKKGYSKEFSVSVTCCSSVLGQIVPPSLIMIIYASTANTSIQAMFMAGLLPGAFLAIMMMVISYFYAIKYNYPREEKMTWKQRGKVFLNSITTLVMPLLIIGGVVSGLTTATESAVIAVVYALVITMFVDKTVDIPKLKKILITTAKGSAVSLFCIGAANVFGYLMAYFRVNILVSQLFASLSLGRTGFIFVTFLLFLVLGCFMDSTPAIYIFVPIIAPLAAQYGIHPIHIGMIVCLTLAFGLVTPPYGLCLLLSCQIAKINPKAALKDVGIMLAGITLVLILLFMLPDVLLFLPRLICPAYV